MAFQQLDATRRSVRANRSDPIRYERPEDGTGPAGTAPWNPGRGSPMEAAQRVLFVDPSNGFYRMRKYLVGDYFGPVDLGLHLADRWRSLNIGAGLFAARSSPARTGSSSGSRSATSTSSRLT